MIKRERCRPQNSASVNEDLMNQLREMFPGCFDGAALDFDKMRAMLGDDIDSRPERYSFTWAGKRDCIRLLETGPAGTLVPCPEESINFDTTNNIFIEGENLEVLKILYKSYFGRVKMIYIDPPYNTGHDFIYPDKFDEPLEEYFRLTGQKDAEGNLLTSNPETSGRYHSAWLSMMYPRLFLARQLLREDGVIFISIDDNEVHNLRMVMNEVFGEENFIAEFTWKNVYGGGAKSKYVVPQHEYIVFFAKDKMKLAPIELPPDKESRQRYTERDEKYSTRGPYFTQPLATTSFDLRPNLRFPIYWEGEEIWPEKQWQWSKVRVDEALKNNELVIKKENGKYSVRYKQYLRDEDGKERGAKFFSVKLKPWSQEGTSEIAKYFGDGKVFPFPKPSSLVKHFVSMCWDCEDAIILDFFAGSCPTAQALLELNRDCPGRRSFVMVQLPEPTPEDSAARKVGFKNISGIGKERIKRVSNELLSIKKGMLDLESNDQPEDLGFRVFKLEQSNFKPWKNIENREEYEKKMELFNNPFMEGWKPEDVIYEVAVKVEGYGLNIQVEKVTLKKGNTYYTVTDPDRDQSFRICLDDELLPETIKAMNLKKDDLFICRDTALTDEQAANLALQCRFKVI